MEVVAVHEGAASTVTIALRGLVGQLFREDNARKIKRGLSGRIAQGLSAGGLPYGYRADPKQKGGLLVVEEEADLVRTIFRQFADGDSPIKIAQKLTLQGVRPPRDGRGWQARTIYRWAARGSGIRRNTLYAGRLTWNKSKMLKDPATGKRVSRKNR